MVGPMIHLSNGNLSLDLHPIGARMAGLTFHGRDLILRTPERFDPHSDWGYLGAVMGPVTNRITLGPHLENWDGPQDGIILHGNPNGVHAMTWALAERSETSARFTLTLPRGHGHFLANRTLSAEYTLSADDVLTMTLTAKTDAPTYLNLASHPYWCLGEGPGTHGHRLEISADTILPIDENTCPTGEVAPVDGTAYDFRKAKHLSPNAPALDHNFCLSDARRAHPVHAATLTSDDGWTMRMATTEPGLQVYDGRTIEAYGLEAYAGIALEPQLWPDAPAHRHFPSIWLEPGAPYHAISTFAFMRA